MTEFIKKIIQWKLRLLVRVYLRLNNIEIVAITGSAGKTTTKSTLGQIVPPKKLYVPKEAYNTEVGLPLAIFHESAPDNPKNLISWLLILSKMMGKLFLPSPYKRIVLEYGADKPGDITYLTSFAHPHIAIVTSVLPVHLEGFTDIKAIAKEKSQLVRCLKATDIAILNSDDPNVKSMKDMTQASVITYGQKDADICYSSLKYNEQGMAFDINWKGNAYQVNIPVVAPQMIPSYLSAFAVGLTLGEDPKTLARGLSHITAEKGRMNLLKGLYGSVIIDDSYNSNPESAKAALGVLASYSGRKIAVLGSMNELGDFERAGHEQVGEMAAKVADEVIVVGEVASRFLYPVALKKLNKNIVQKFDSSDKAGEYLAKMITKGDVVLVKGSQNGVFTEEVVKRILANPERAVDMLVRQGPMWKNKKGINHG